MREIKGIFSTIVLKMNLSINGDILSCVGTSTKYDKFIPDIDSLKRAIQEGIETVSLRCIPRIEEAERLEKEIPYEERKVLELKKQE